MARTRRLYRVRGVDPHGKTAQRVYQTPEAANYRRDVWELSDYREVSVTPSYPVRFPAAAGDPAEFDIPNSVVPDTMWRAICGQLGLTDVAVLSLSVADDMLVIEYDPTPDKPGKTEPRTWRVQIEREVD